MKKTIIAALLGTAALGAVPAEAHISFADARVYAGKSFVVTANIPHGCEDAGLVKHDTVRIEMTLPVGVTGARPADAPWGEASVVDNGDGTTTLIWDKGARTPLATDTNLYQVTFRATAPNTPLTVLDLDTVQSCEGGTQTTWAASAGSEAPQLKVLPSRAAGWNKFTAQADILQADFSALFGDAVIVWSGGAAYSANANVSALINNALTVIPAGQDYWVKY